MITRPPEIISCFCIAGPTKTIFLIFDSHPRPDLHPEGAAFVCYASADAAANYLARLLQYDPSLFADGDVQWEAQLLDNFSGHVFVSKQPSPSADDWAAATLEASLQILHVRAECADLKSRNAVLDGEIAELRREVARYKEARAAEQTSSMTSRFALWTGFGSSTTEQTVTKPSRGTTPTQSWYSASASKTSYGLGYPSTPVAEDARKRITPQPQQSSNHANSARSAYGQTLNTPPPSLSGSARAREKARAPRAESPYSISPAPSSYASSTATAKPSYSKGKARLESPKAAGSDAVSSDWEFALRQQLLFSKEDSNLLKERAELLGAEKAGSPRAGPSSSVAPAPSIYGRLGAAVAKSSSIGRSARLASSKAPPPVIPSVNKDILVLTDLEFALQQQLLLNEEDANLSEERAKLLSLAPRTFACGVCFEKIPEDFVSELAECGHKYCRDCIRQYVSSELSVPRFPIVCPLCKADETRREPAGESTYSSYTMP